MNSNAPHPAATVPYEAVYRRLGRTRSQALVEFALTLPVWLVLLLGVMDFGRGFYAAVSAQQAAREGARIGAGSSAGITVQQIQDRVVYALGYTCSGCPDLLDLTGSSQYGLCPPANPCIRIGGYNASGA